jgi:hypothetical protein
MPAYLRKAFTFGPFRLNLSKSGLGLSFGVTGLRIGTGPKGPYIHAGRGGLYFRKSLKDIQENQNEIIEEEIETPTEPQSLLKKIYTYGANFVVASFIIMLVITIIFIYFSIDFLKFAIKADRNSKKKTKKR